jgi:hypothetical protein
MKTKFLIAMIMLMSCSTLLATGWVSSRNSPIAAGIDQTATRAGSTAAPLMTLDYEAMHSIFEEEYHNLVWLPDPRYGAANQNALVVGGHRIQYIVDAGTNQVYEMTGALGEISLAGWTDNCRYVVFRGQINITAAHFRFLTFRIGDTLQELPGVEIGRLVNSTAFAKPT